jgi:segregation and condensation protein B
MLKSKIESILFIAARPLTLKRLMEVTESSKEEVLAALDEIAASYTGDARGVRLLRNGNEVQFSTSPDNSKLVQEYLKDETTGELTKPSLETLTIVAYRGPISKAELEQVRGVNCSLILRNLLMRGLVEVEGDPHDPSATFRVTMDFIRFLGISGVEELPEYDKLRSHENVVRVLEMAGKPKEAEAAVAADSSGESPAAAEAATESEIAA